MKDITIHISGKEWTIRFKSKSRDSSFNSWTRIMDIGCRDSGDVKENLCHELLEAIFVEHGLRFQQPLINPDNGDYLFIANHKEFQNVARDYAAVQVELSKLTRED